MPDGCLRQASDLHPVRTWTRGASGASRRIVWSEVRRWTGTDTRLRFSLELYTADHPVDLRLNTPEDFEAWRQVFVGMDILRSTPGK